ncbi:MAG: tetratricopeptide repeat protein [Sandaracinaceae bacterium]|nr:tetratricopeptide repeat protein [Myxococcales bacterium]MCB9661330.1 tetratricopeptide repeat protein [Sandaracinaceae bacterium]
MRDPVHTVRRRPAAVSWMHVGAVIAALAASLASAPRAFAGDFWDEVRRPGLNAYQAHVRRARTALASRQVDVALEATQQAIAALPDEAEAHGLRAIALAERGDAAGMAGEATLALSLDEDVFGDPVWSSRAALAFAAGGEPELSARVLRRALATMPATHLRRQLYTLLGDVAQALGPEHLEEATRAYRVALKSGPADSRTILGLGLSLHRSGQREEALVLLRRAAAPGPLDQLIAGLPLSAAERAARVAVLAVVAGDVSAARAALAVAAVDSPHATWARATLDDVEGTRPASRTTTRGPRRPRARAR